MKEIAPTRLETISIIVFLVIVLVNTYSFFAYCVMAGWVSSFSLLSVARVVKH